MALLAPSHHGKHEASRGRALRGQSVDRPLGGIAMVPRPKEAAPRPAWRLDRIRNPGLTEDQIARAFAARQERVRQVGASPVPLGPEMQALLRDLKIPVEEAQTRMAWVYPARPDARPELLVAVTLRDVDRMPHTQRGLCFSSGSVQPGFDLTHLRPEHLNPHVYVQDKLGSNQYYAWMGAIMPVQQPPVRS